MRTTITLEPDVEVLVQTAMRERGLSFKDAVNEALRRGLRRDVSASRTYRQRTFALGGNPAFPWEKALAQANALEDEEILRKMAVGK